MPQPGQHHDVGIQPADSYCNIENTTEELWDRILGVNLKSYFLMAKCAIPEIGSIASGPSAESTLALAPVVVEATVKPSAA